MIFASKTLIVLKILRYQSSKLQKDFEFELSSFVELAPRHKVYGKSMKMIKK
jgi:hypothetical protein